VSIVLRRLVLAPQGQTGPVKGNERALRLHSGQTHNSNESTQGQRGYWFSSLTWANCRSACWNLSRSCLFSASVVAKRSSSMRCFLRSCCACVRACVVQNTNDNDRACMPQSWYESNRTSLSSFSERLGVKANSSMARSSRSCSVLCCLRISCISFLSFSVSATGSGIVYERRRSAICLVTTTW